MLQNVNLELIAFVLNSVAVIGSIIAVFIAIYQCKLARISFESAKVVYDSDRRIYHQNNLPNRYWIINAQHILKNWIKDLEVIKRELQFHSNTGKYKSISTLSNYCIEGPEGLVDDFLVKNTPEWLSTMVSSGAKYYYHVAVNLKTVIKDIELNKKSAMLIELINETDISVHFISEINNYLNNSIPEWFLNCPDSPKDEYFYSKSE